MVDYNTLTYFMAVCHYKSISRAAEDIHISRQALSKAIANFERSVGRELFIRTPGGLVPTQEATNLIPHIKSIIHEYKCMYSDRLMATLNSQKVTIATFDAFSQVFSTEFFRDFIAQYPDTVINIEESTDEIAKEQLLLHECDYAILSDAVNYTDFNYEFLFHAPYGIFVNKTHPLASKEHITCKDLANEKLIGKTQKLKYYLQYIKDISNLQSDVNFVLELTNNGTARNLIKNNVAIAVAWDYTYFSDIDDDVVFCPVSDMGNGMDIYFVENKNYEYTPKQKQLKKYLLGWFKEQMKPAARAV